MNKAIPHWIRNLAIARRVPLFAHIDLTFSCNENCVHCYRVEEAREELSTKELFDVLSALRELGCLFLTFSGGEPTLRQDLWKIIAEARRQRFSVRLKSNLIALDANDINRVRSLNLTAVETSLYGAKAQTHDQITGLPGSWAKTTHNIQQLTRLKVPVVINCSVMDLNKDEIAQVRSLADELEASRTNIDVVITPRTNRDSTNCRYCVSPATGAQLMLPDAASARDYDQSKEQTVAREAPVTTTPIDVMCSAGHSMIYINPYGDVTPCVAFPLICGNVKIKPIDEIWTASERLCHFRTFGAKDRQPCLECDIKNLCNFCPGLDYLTQGSFVVPEPETCERARAFKERKDSLQ